MNIYKDNNNVLKLIYATIALFILTVCVYSLILGWKINCDNPENLIIIEKGASANSIADQLKEEFCINNINIFKLGLLITLKNKSIRAGRYNLKGISTVGQLINILTSQSNEQVKVTLIEGWSMERYADELHNQLQLDKDKFLKLCRDYNFASSLGIDAPSLEGFLFPDTYILLKTYTEQDVITVLVNQFKYH